MEKGSFDVLVVGAGLAGLAMSTLLARQGRKVLIVEAYGDPRVAPPRVGRSINMTLSARGIRVFNELALGETIAPLLAPVHNRQLHNQNGSTELQRYDLFSQRAIYSIQRAAMHKVLCTSAEQAGVKIAFSCKWESLNEHDKEITVNDNGRCRVLPYSKIIFADGARSKSRTMLTNKYAVDSKITNLRHVYKEILVPPSASANINRDALHVWPRNDYLLLALPNIDGSFSATIFFPEEQLSKFRTAEEVNVLFKEYFADFFFQYSSVAEEFLRNPVGSMLSVNCARWSFPGDTLLLGDSAHAMPPFFGQGLNCALEGCLLLASMLPTDDSSWKDILEEFERIRRPDVEAISLLSFKNQDNLRVHVSESRYALVRSVEEMLQRRFPERFMPLYEMVAFSHLPYSVAYERSIQQASLVDELIGDFTHVDHIHPGRAARILERSLPLLPLKTAPGDMVWMKDVKSECVA